MQTLEIACPSCDALLVSVDARAPLRQIALRCQCGETVRLDNRLDPATRTRSLRPQSTLASTIAAAQSPDERLRAYNDALADAERSAARAHERVAALRSKRDTEAGAIAAETIQIHDALRKAGFDPEKLKMSPAQVRDLFATLGRL